MTANKRRVVVPALAALVALAAVAAYVFQPWKLWTDDVVDEALPGVTDVAGRPAAGGGTSVRVLATGRFVSHEHTTSGTVRVLELPDGDRVLRLEDFATSNGPALEVWLADAPVVEGRDGWFVFDDGEHAELGELKGNIGDQNYAVPATVDLDRLSSVSIWCDRFDVSFGAAELRLRL
jgi:hypothetical protein